MNTETTQNTQAETVNEAADRTVRAQVEVPSTYEELLPYYYLAMAGAY